MLKVVLKKGLTLNNGLPSIIRDLSAWNLGIARVIITSISELICKNIEFLFKNEIKTTEGIA